MSTLLAEPVAGEPAPAEDRPPRTRPPRPFVVHVLALAAALAIALVLVRPQWPSLSDEGAALAQVDSLHDGDGWLTAHPLPAVDPDGAAFPLDLSARSASGDRYAALAKHPLYATVLRVPYAIGGPAGAFATAVAGTLAAAIVAALLARRLDPRLDRGTLWLVGVGSPLLYDAYLLIAHSLGAAAVGTSVLLLTSPRHRRRAVPCGLAALLVAQLLRNEAVLLGVALAVALGTEALVRRSRVWVVGLAVLGVTGVAYRLDAWLANRVLGPGSTSPFRIDPTGSFVHDRLLGAFNALVRLPDEAVLARACLSGMVVAVVIGARRVSNGSEPRSIGTWFALAGGLAAAAFLAAPASLVPGFVFAAPVVVCGLALLDRAALHTPGAAVLATTTALFTLAVLATQYSDAGNAWGGRYLAVGVPLVAPLAALGIQRAAVRLPRPAARRMIAGLVVAGVSLAAMAVTSISFDHRRAEAIEDMMTVATRGVEAGDGDPRPVVVATERGYGRLAWPLVREQRWLHVPVDDLAIFGPRLQAADVGRFVLMTRSPRAATAALDPWFRPTGDPVRTSISVPWEGRTLLDPVVVEFIAR